MRRGRLGRVLALVAAGVTVGGCSAKATLAQQAARSEVPLSVCPCEAVGLAVARGGGEQRLLLAGPRAVWEVGPDGELTERWKAPRFSRVLRLETADLDGDGWDEWIVHVDAGRVRAHVLAAADGIEPWAKPWPGWLAPAERGGQPVLLGQRSQAGGPVAVLARQGQQLTVQERLPVPPAWSPFELAFVPGEPERLFVLESTDRITERDVRSPRGVLWRSDGRPVARPVELKLDERDLLGESVARSVRLPAPVHSEDFDGDGQRELVLVGGNATPVVVLQNLRVREGGDVRVYELRERGLAERARTPVLGVQVAAATPWTWRGRRVLAGAVWTRLSGGFGKPETRLFLFDVQTGNVIEPWAAEPDEPRAPAARAPDGARGPGSQAEAEEPLEASP